LTVGAAPAAPPPRAFDFSLANGGTMTLVPASSGVTMITAVRVNGTTQQISFSAVGFPTGVTSSFSQGSCAPTCNSNLTITTSSSAPAGSYPITVTAGSAGLSRSTTFILMVTALPPVAAPQPVAAPTLTPSGGSFSGSISVTMETATVGAAIYFSTDGSTPTQSSRLYNGAVTVTSSAVVKAKAYKSSNTPSAEASASFTISQPFNFTLSNSGNLSVQAGASATDTISATLSSGISQAVTLSAAGLPAGATASFASSSCSPNCATVVTLRTSGATPAGSFPITITATGGGVTKTTAFGLIVATATPPTPTPSPTPIPTPTPTPSPTATSGIYYVAPNLASSGDGSYSNPWELQAALCGGVRNSTWCGGSAQPIVGPGDTIYLRGGTYNGTFEGELRGTPAAPITVRSAPQEWAVVDSHRAFTLANPLMNTAARTTVILNSPLWIKAGQVLKIENEYLYVNSTPSAYTSSFTAVRGWNGSVPVQHNAGTAGYMTGNAFAVPVGSSDVIYRDFEVMDSNPVRVYTVAGDASIKRGGAGFMVHGPRNKFINLVLHDNLNGIYFADSSIDCEIYGTLVFNNGHVDPVRGHGHGLYMHNAQGAKKYVRDVISFNNFATGMKAYGVTGYSDGFEIDGVISFNNGAPAYYYGTPITGVTSFNKRFTNLFVGNDVKPQDNIRLTNNYLYHAGNMVVELCNMGVGYLAVGTHFTVQNNFVMGGDCGVTVGNIEDINFTGNTIWANSTGRAPLAGAYPRSSVAGSTSGIQYNWDYNTYYDNNSKVTRGYRSSFSYSFPGLTIRNRFGGGILAYNEPSSAVGKSWLDWTGFDIHSVYQPGRPTGVKVVVRANQYEPGRANIAIYNFDLNPSVTVNLSTTALQDGDPFEIRDVQDYFGMPVVTGIYNANNPNVIIPMAGGLAARPIGHVYAPAHTAPEFGAFVVRKK
jgi:hypothetical protein